MRKTKTGNATAIVHGWLYFEDVAQAAIGTDLFFDLLEDKHTNAVRVVSFASDWTELYWNGSDFAEAIIKLEMTIRSEMKSGKKYWYAYRRHGGKLQKRYVGQSEQVTAQRLADVARKML